MIGNWEKYSLENLLVYLAEALCLSVYCLFASRELVKEGKMEDLGVIWGSLKGAFFCLLVITTGIILVY